MLFAVLRSRSRLLSAPQPGAGPLARWLRWGPPALVVAATLAAFLPGLSNDFVNWDDPKNFLDNPAYRGLGPHQLIWMFTSFHMGHYIPITWITFGLDYLLWGMNPLGYHLTSILFHAATALAFYFLSLRLLRLALRGTAETDLRVGALLAALLFAVHPLRAESVAWVTERRDVVSGLFMVLAALAYISAVEGVERPRPRWYWGSLGLFACALLAKSIAVGLLPAFVVMDVYPLGRLGDVQGWRRWNVWIEKLPFLVLSFTAAVVGFLALFTLANAASMIDLGLAKRILLSVYGLAFYLFTSIMPIGLSPLYPLAGVRVTWWHFATVVGAIVIGIAMRRRWPGFAAAGIVYAAMLFPVLGVFQNGLQATADRYTYQACLGWALLLGGLAAHPWRGRAVARTVLGIWILVMLPLTWSQVRIWRDAVSLWERAVAVAPGNRAAHFNLGAAHDEAGRYAAAVAEYEEVARLSRGKGPWSIRIGWNYEKVGVDSLALAAFRKALALEPGLPAACEGLKRVAARLGVPADPPAECGG